MEHLLSAFRIVLQEPEVSVFILHGLHGPEPLLGPGWETPVGTVDMAIRFLFPELLHYLEGLCENLVPFMDVTEWVPVLTVAASAEGL